MNVLLECISLLTLPALQECKILYPKIHMHAFYCVSLRKNLHIVDVAKHYLS
jgi:hypothetical protein